RLGEKATLVRRDTAMFPGERCSYIVASLRSVQAAEPRPERCPKALDRLARGSARVSPTAQRGARARLAPERTARTLRRSTMSSPSFLRRAGPLVLARFASAVVTTVVPLVLARAMAIAEYGTYKQLFLVGTTLTAIFTFGLPQSLYYFMPRT